MPKIYALVNRRKKSLVKKFIAFKHKIPKETKANNVMKKVLNQLLDLAPANLKELLLGSSRLNTEWEEDWKF